MPKKIDKELEARAVRLVTDDQGEYGREQSSTM